MVTAPFKYIDSPRRGTKFGARNARGRGSLFSHIAVALSCALNEMYLHPVYSVPCPLLLRQGLRRISVCVLSVASTSEGSRPLAETLTRERGRR